MDPEPSTSTSPAKSTPFPKEQNGDTSSKIVPPSRNQDPFSSSPLSSPLSTPLPSVPEENRRDPIIERPNPQYPQDPNPPTPPPPPPKARAMSTPEPANYHDLYRQLRDDLVNETRSLHQNTLHTVEQTRQGMEERIRSLPSVAYAAARRESETLLHRGLSAGATSLRRALHPSEDHPNGGPPIRTLSIGIEDRARSPSLSGNGDQRSTTNPLEWVVPIQNKFKPSTAGEKIEMTIIQAELEVVKTQGRAKLTGMAVNICIGLQVILGALTTALSAVTVGKQTNIMTSITGALATVVATMLAKLKGMGEPEASKERQKDLQSFVRDCKAFQSDHGAEASENHKAELSDFRGRLEEILGNRDSNRSARRRSGASVSKV